MLDAYKRNIVKLRSGNDVLGTGFFISKEGHVLTCHHNLKNVAFDTLSIEVTDSGTVYDVVICLQDELNDIAVLKVANETIEVDFFLFKSSFGTDRQEVFTFGFPDIDTFNGIASYGTVVDCNIDDGGYRRIQTRFKEVESGFSGAPLIHNGYVIGMVSQIVKPDHNLRNLETTFCIPSETISELVPECNYSTQEDFLLRDVQAHNSKELARLKHLGVYEKEVHLKRAISTQLEDFLTSEELIFLLAGQSGAGKTSTVVNFIEERDDSRALYIDCSNYYELGFKEIIASKIRDSHLQTNESEANFFLKLEEELSAPMVFIFDSIEALNSMNVQYFKAFLQEVKTYSAHSEKKYINIILTINKDYLIEYFPNFSPITNFNVTAYHYELFYIHGNQPFFELARFDYKGENSELSQVYELYRKAGFIQHSGATIGVKPNTLFDQINHKLKSLISHPFTLRAFLISYHKKEIPNDVTGVEMYQSLIDKHLFEDTPNYSKQKSFQLKQLLAALADKVYFSGEDILYADELSVKNNENQEHLVNHLLLETPILKEIAEEFDPFGRRAIRFTSDWYYEYFLFLSMFEKLRIAKSYQARTDIIDHYINANNSQYLNGLKAIAILAEVILFKKTRFKKELIFNLVNATEETSKYQRFTHLLFDSLRMNYNFKNINKEALLSHALINQEGSLKVLHYVDSLEHNGYYEDALELLGVATFWETFADAPLIHNRYLLSLAFNEFHSHNTKRSALYIDQIDAAELQNNLAKYHFVKGRCYQFQQEYDTAISTYKQSAEEESEYGFRCAHQLAFTTMMKTSDFKQVGSLLEDILHKMSNVIPHEQQLVSKLLYATCLYRSDAYEESEEVLQEIIKSRRRSRNSHKEGTALRALAELYFFQFDREKALETVDTSIKLLSNTPYFLSLAYSLDVKAQIQAVIVGDLESALILIDQALALGYKAKKNEAAISWSLQTKAMILGLQGDLEAMNTFLAKSEVLGHSPFQKLLSEYIVLLAHSIEDSEYRLSHQNQILELIEKFKSKDMGWFPMILELLLEERTESSVKIHPRIHAKAFEKSFIYEKIVHGL
jgi:tetratricopeptide (TPR) repeat protein